MFGIIADFIASVTTILLPAYISFKALKSSDPAELAPWLIYFVLLGLTLLVESWTYWIIGWLPFYAWIRLGFLLYLVLPQTQGAKVLYLSYVEPFIVHHERNIDEFIGHAHERLQSAGLGYLSQVVDIIRDKLLGQAAPQQTTEIQATSAAGYAQNLLSRFAMPDARNNAASFYDIASGAAGLFAGMSAPASQTRDFSSHSTGNVTLPSGTNLEKSNYIASERARLANMLRTLEKEQQTIDLAYGSEPSTKTSNLATSHSEASFESISHSDVLPIPPSLIPGQKSSPAQRRTTSGNWVKDWFASTSPTPGEESRPATGRNVSGQSTGGKGWSAAKDMTDAIQGTSSGVDTGDVEMPGRRY